MPIVGVYAIILLICLAFFLILRNKLPAIESRNATSVPTQPAVRVAKGPIVGAIVLGNLLTGLIGAVLYMIASSLH